MSKSLENRVALVTGSTSGIGKAIAESLAQHGARVVVTGRRDQLGKQVVEKIRASGGSAEFFRADLESDQQARALVEFTAQTLGGLDLLVNNAGFIGAAFKADGSSLDGPIHLTDESFWDQIYRVSLRSVLLLSKLAIPYLLNSKHAAILHISSALALQGFGVDVYSTMKGALVSLTRSMAVSYAHQIRVNCVCPGTVIVERNSDLWVAYPEMYAQKKLGSLTRVGIPDDIAQCVLYLASADFVTGAIFAVDGGMSVKGAPIPRPNARN